MIVQLTGNVTYSITLDPTVWIFDDRKVEFDQAFSNENPKQNKDDNELKKASERFDREVNQHRIKPPVNKSISRFERNKILENTYVMPIKDFLETAQINNSAKQARLVTTNTENTISLDELTNCFLLFAKKGKPLTEDGPVHLFFKDGSNKDEPIKGINKIIIE
ncbi:hypothetical protein [Aquibacillus saliphilus]|uniref:hypothetical protein n=1 Tax=Aquibacillus saliphilus TaxID=1909422 RepID=UPI001CEFFDBA